MERVLLVCALASILSVLFITVFVFAEGLPLFRSVSVREFLFGTNWQPASASAPHYGILSFIVGTLVVTLPAAFFSPR